MQTKNILLAILGAASLTSCDIVGGIFSKDVNCPGFPEHLVDYYPYKQGDTLKFANQNNDTISFTVSSVAKSQEETIEAALGCGGANFYVYTTKWDSFYIFMSIVLTLKPVINCDFIYDNPFGQTIYPYDYFWVATTKDPFDKKNAALFGNTIDLNKPDATRINHVVVNKGHGIVEFFDKKFNCAWKRIK
jgi:hypothetical protein